MDKGSGGINNNILFEISKYIDTETDVGIVQQALSSTEASSRRRQQLRGLLESRLTARPSIGELETRNIIKKNFLSFRKIHEVLNGINFRMRDENRIAPSIAQKGSKVDFCIKKKLMIHKLGLEDLEGVRRQE